MLRHIFMWQVAEGCDNQEIIDLLDSLKGLEPLRSWELAAHQGEPNENGRPWDGVLISDFDDWVGLEEYSNHPLHSQVVEKLLPMVSERAVVDFVREEA
ncbi:Dabb family protein [Geodermatophilus ruber]|uniref:Stress responsive A/B Barrel Domain n=1 Tax=Geodermatophilus ruber TaxID=504800 RepID=A0A1I4G4Q2_9ACTN|nr:Dabb family protein [Geodermatophilus ruber]SFL24061.1 Stress responsive A/B Barrel Domain [Geodermatophilus ruber]